MANYADIPAANLCERHNLAYVDICPLCVTDDLIARRALDHGWVEIQADYLEHLLDLIGGD